MNNFSKIFGLMLLAALLLGSLWAGSHTNPGPRAAHRHAGRHRPCPLQPPCQPQHKPCPPAQLIALVRSQGIPSACCINGQVRKRQALIQS